jgi:hypothetical protein
LALVKTEGRVDRRLLPMVSAGVVAEFCSKTHAKRHRVLVLLKGKLYQAGKLRQVRSRRDKSLLRQDGQILFRGKGWIFEPGADLADDLAE